MSSGSVGLSDFFKFFFHCLEEFFFRYCCYFSAVAVDESFALCGAES